jgi:aspartate racemase
VRQVGLLATTGTIHASLYQQWLNRYGITVLIPDTDLQAEVLMPAIHAVKGGASQAETTPAFLQVAAALVHQGAEVLIAACTEVPLGFEPACNPVSIVDPTTVLATAVLERVGTPTRQRTSHTK